jgi:hypothetical protein
MANDIIVGVGTEYGTIDTDNTQTTGFYVTGNKLVDISLNFSQGTFVGSVHVQRLSRTDTGTAGDTAWNNIVTYTGTTEVTLQSATDRNYRLDVDVTSGELGFEMTAGEGTWMLSK